MDSVYNLGMDDPIVKPHLKDYYEVVQGLDSDLKIFYTKVLDYAESGESIKFNQYNSPKTALEWTRYFVMLIIHGSKEHQSSESRFGYPALFTCWESTRGNKSGQYYRTNFQSKKVLTYNAIAVAFYGQPNGEDISHLCGNPRCVRPSHIYYESHQINISRINCCGMIFCTRTKKYLKNVCVHYPKCKKVFIDTENAVPFDSMDELVDF